SLAVTVKVPDRSQASRARAEALKFIQRAVQDFGDVDQLQARASAHLAEHGFPDATISIQRRHTKDLGETSFHYRMRGPAQVLMDIVAADAGQKETTYDVTKMDADEQEDERERHGERSR